MLQDHREQLIENKGQKNKLFAAHGKRYYQWHHKAVSTAHFYACYADGSMPFVVGDDTTDALKPLNRSAKISEMVFK